MPEELVNTLDRYGLVTAFPIQSATIADALAGRDVLGKARTGSGKTLGFGLPMLARLAQMGKPAPREAFAIVMVPTRELAMQVGDALEPYTHALGLSQRLVAGGLSMSKQIVSLERGVHLVVATPGRLADLVRRGHVTLGSVRIAVLDEADHMAEMGFGEEIAELLALTPADGQRLLFSATLDGVVDQLVSRFMNNPVLHDVTSGSDKPSQRHVVLAIPPHEKYQTATRIAARDGRTLCFVRTKLAADRVAAEMREAGVLAVALHGDRSQHERNLAMTEFRAGRLPVLIATDVAARGIHVDAVDLVLQIDPPADYRDYTHRSGRTGRAGADGLAVTMILPHQRASFARVLDKAGVKAEQAAFRNIDAEALAAIDALTGGREPSRVPVAEPAPAPSFDRRGRPTRGGGRPGADRFGRERPFRDSRPPRAADGEWEAKARALEEKERALAERERRLAEREAAASAVEREAKATRPPREATRSESTGDRPYANRPYGDRAQGERSTGDRSSGPRSGGPRSTGGRPTTERKNGYPKRDDRLPEATSRPDRERPSGDDDAPRWERSDRPFSKPRTAGSKGGGFGAGAGKSGTGKSAGFGSGAGKAGTGKSGTGKSGTGKSGGFGPSKPTAGPRKPRKPKG